MVKQKIKITMKKIIFIFTLAIISSCNFTNSTKISLDLIPYGQSGKVGYFNSEGKIIINPQFASGSMFRDGLALVKTDGKDGKWGFINEEGKFVINATYKDATIFQEGIAFVVTENGSPVAINKKGEVQFTLKNAEEVYFFSEGLAAFSVEDKDKIKWGFVDKKGKTVINPQFKDVNYFNNGKCAVQNDEGKWGYIDKEGKIIINNQFDYAYDFIGDYASVRLDEKVGVIDEDGKYIINPQFNSIFSDGEIFIVNQDDKMGWCDKEGKFVINPQFEHAFFFHENKFASFQSDDKYGYIDKEGKIIINPQFDFALPFIKGKALVKNGDKYGIINEEGKYEVNPQFENISFDFLYALIDNDERNTLFKSVKTDYINIDKIINTINFDKPEGFTFEDGFKSIIKKLNVSSDEISSYSSTHNLIKDKEISKDAAYTFGVLGSFKEYNYNTYDYYLTNNKPEGFVYSIDLKNKAYLKAENVYKALLSKVANYETVKKGTINDKGVIVLKNKTQQVVIATENSSQLSVYIVNKDFDLSNNNIDAMSFR